MCVEAVPDNRDMLDDERRSVMMFHTHAPPKTTAAQIFARWRMTTAFAGQALLILAILFLLLDGWRRDFHIPLRFSSDALTFLMQTKSTLDHGWWWSNPKLAAPSTLDARAFPLNTNVDQAVVWLFHLFTKDAGLVINLAWMFLVAASGGVAAFCLMKLSVSRPMSFAAGTLYAISPYALYRDIDHFNLMIYLVPIPCATALLIASGRIGSRLSRANAVFLVGSALLGFNYIYYAFFGCFLIVVAVLIRYVNCRDRSVIWTGALFLALIGGATLINMAPTVSSWWKHGLPTIIREKTPAEAEVYGLKIRQLISPVFEHTFPPFGRWAKLEGDARYPLETENMISRLGFLASLGFGGLLGVLFAPRLATGVSDRRVLLNAGRLALAAVLLATVGGFGSLFNLLVSADIRAYNRLCPFISFFSWTALALWIDAALAQVPAFRSRPWRRPAALCGLVLVGVYDQGHAAIHLNRDYDQVRGEFAALKAFVGSLEQRLPEGAMVFQLPLTTYLNDEGRARMRAYDHFKPYVVSKTIHWSYPALSNKQTGWQQRIGRLPPAQLPGALQAEGFAAILIDRYGYEDQGESLLAQVVGPATQTAVLAEGERYIAIDLRAVPKSAALVKEEELSSRPLTSSVPVCGRDPLVDLVMIGRPNLEIFRDAAAFDHARSREQLLIDNHIYRGRRRLMPIVNGPSTDHEVPGRGNRYWVGCEPPSAGGQRFLISTGQQAAERADDGRTLVLRPARRRPNTRPDRGSAVVIRRLIRGRGGLLSHGRTRSQATVWAVRFRIRSRRGPRCRTLRISPSVLSQPKISSTRLRRRWLTAWPAWRVVRPSIALVRWVVFCATCSISSRWLRTV
jgi:phosphoglycerol transferase